MNNIKISILVPSLNVGNYIEQCIESIISQTLHDIEIICIDAGSTDGTLETLEKFANKDSRIKLINSPIKSYGYQMNLGIDAARGEYIGIVESDDCIAPDMYETLYNAAIKDDLDVVKSDFSFWWGSLDQSINVNVAFKPENYNVIFDRSRIEERLAFWLMNWTGIYKTSFLRRNDIRHNETPGASYQDNGFWLQVMAMANSVMWINKTFYKYRQDNPMASMKRRDKMMDTMVEYDFAIEKLKQHGIIDVLDIISYYRLRENKGAFMRIDDSLKREYLPVVVDNYNRYKHSFDLIKTHTPCKSIQTWFETLMTDPEGYCDKYISARREIMSRIDSAKKIYIYGSGNCALNVFKRLYNFQVFDKIAAVVETNDCMKKIFGFDVKNSDVIENNSNSLIIICAYREQAYNEIYEIVTDKGCYNIMNGKDVVDNFYAL